MISGLQNCWTDGQTVGQTDRPWDRWTDCVTYGQTVETDGQTSHIEGHRRPVDRQTDWSYMVKSWQRFP